MNRWSRGISTLATVSLLAVACGGEPGGGQTASHQAVAVEVSHPRRASADQSYPATVEAAETIDLATRISGTIERIPVDVGTRVGAGDTLVALDQHDVQARVAAATAQVQVARKAHARMQALARDGAAAEQELDEAVARLESAEAVLEEAGAQLAYTALRAPFSGVITARRADPGSLAVPGQPILTLSGASGLKLTAELPGRLAGGVAVGDSLWASREGIELAATVSRVVPALELDSRRFRIEAELPAQSGVVPGTYMRLALASAGNLTAWLPADAVVRNGQLTGVFTVEEGRLRLRWVRLGESRHGAVELLSGWLRDRPVVRSPRPGLEDGAPVESVDVVDWSPTLQAEAMEGTDEE